MSESAAAVEREGVLFCGLRDVVREELEDDPSRRYQLRKGV